MRIYTLSDKGQVRQKNEDYAESIGVSRCFANGAIAEAFFIALADGIGGEAFGEVASALAVKTLKADFLRVFFNLELSELQSLNKLKLLNGFIKEANRVIYTEASASSEKAGMGTTIVACLIENNSLYIAHAGDSRCCLFRTGCLRQLTKDHSLVQQYVDSGMISCEEAFWHPHKNIITKALGIEASISPSLSKVSLERGDLVLVYSDGLCGYVQDEKIKDIIENLYKPKNTDLKLMADNLIKEAYLNGGSDNISICLYQH